MATVNRWSELEDQMVACYWPKHDEKWDGWKEVLPNRTPRAIAVRAYKLRVSRRKPCAEKPKKKPRGDARHYKTEFKVEPDPNEKRVMRMMRSGMTPREIDEAMGWYPSTTRKIMAARWKRDKDKEGKGTQ